MTEIIGYAGLILLLLAWVPQTMETIKKGSTPVNLAFIILYVVSSGLLATYAVLKNDTIFIILNVLLTFGSGINLFYKINPRKTH